jgi:uroporphyrinogen-III synthase
MISLSPLVVTPALRKTAMDMDQVDVIIFVSKNSVRYAMPLLETYWPQFPEALAWVTVGPGTAEELSRYDVTATFPSTPGSEGVLALPELQNVSGRRVLIVRGQGGRELMAASLRARGAEVLYWELYERKPVHYDDWSVLEADAVVILTSVEALQQFGGEVSDRSGLTAVVASARIAEAAQAMGFQLVVNAGAASDQALYDAVMAVQEARNDR